MQFSTSLVAFISLTSTLASPLSLLKRENAVGTFFYGSPSIVSAKGLNDDKDTCNGRAGYARDDREPRIRLPTEWMAGERDSMANCGRMATIYFRPTVSGGMAELPPFTVKSVQVTGVCGDCKSWEAGFDDPTWGQMGGGDKTKARWGPVIQ